MALIEYTPQRILTTENMSTKSVVTSEHWNEIINMLTSQGNNSATAIYNMLNAIAATTGAANIGADVVSVPDKNIQAVLTAFETALNNRYTEGETNQILADLTTTLQNYAVARANEAAAASIPASQKGAPNGVAVLLANGKVDPALLPPAQGGIPVTEKGAANGVAELDETGKVPFNQTQPLDVSVEVLAALGLPVVPTAINTAFIKLNAAFGVTTGTSTALVLSPDNTSFDLVDGAVVRFKLHTDMQKGATLAVGNKAAKPIVDALGKAQKAKAGSYITTMYSATNENFILQGSGGGVQTRNTTQKIYLNKMF